MTQSITNILRTAFSLSSRLLEHHNCHELTQNLIDLLSNIKGISHVSSYEVFGDSLKRSDEATSNEDFLIRRFPLSFDDDFEDDYIDIVTSLIRGIHHGVLVGKYQAVPYIALKIAGKTKPQRFIFMTGSVSDFDFEIIKGLYDIYRNQVTLLDSKERDPLTHLNNRQTMDIIINQVISYYQEKEVPEKEKCSWLAVLDIDHFKRVNDKFGHLYGDEVLLLFSTLMKKHFRFSDFLFRFGGEEFVAILNQTSREGAELSLERFRIEVENFAFPSNAISVSIGYAKLDGSLPQSVVFEKADHALYAAKANGRNQTMFEEIGPNRDDHSTVEIF